MQSEIYHSISEIDNLGEIRLSASCFTIVGDGALDVPIVVFYSPFPYLVFFTYKIVYRNRKNIR